MTHDKRMALLERWYKISLAWNEAYVEFIRVVANAPLFFPLGMSGWHLHVVYTQVVAARVGDRGDWLVWWWYGNDHGRKGMGAKAGRWAKPRKIPTIKALCKLIETDLKDGADHD